MKMGKTTRIQPLLAKDPSSPKRQESAVDMVALSTGLLVGLLGAGQLFAPLVAGVFTGIDAGIGGQVLAALWLVMGAVLAIGGMTRVRSLAIFSAEILVLTALATFAILLLTGASYLAMGIFAVMAAMALATSYLARLSDKAQIKHELQLARAFQEEARQAANRPNYQAD